MERTYIVGDPDIKELATSLDACYIATPSYQSLSSEEIHDFMVSSFRDDIRALILDVESNPSFCLDLAMHVRLSLIELGMNALCPIILLTSIGIKSLLSVNADSQIILTGSVFISSIQELPTRLSCATRLMLENYDRDFLSRISIPSPGLGESDNHHALANEWGATALYRAVAGTLRDIDCSALQDARKKLYFKYVIAKSSDDIQSLAIQGKQVVLKDLNREKLTVNAHGKRVLLIDDMAARGWSYVLGHILRGAEIDVIQEPVHDFSEFSDSAKEKLLKEEYDLYLLDLRLSGADEDEVKDPEAFSGMKVLKEIKKVNWGRQVIIFTASNKAWNLKALMNPAVGANGYYIKESPLSGFSETETRKNLAAFCKDVNFCFERGYLKDYFQLKERISKLLPSEDRCIQECSAQMDLAFDSADRAVTKEQFKYSFISLFQIFELLIKHLTRDNRYKEPGKRILQLRGDSRAAEDGWSDALAIYQVPTASVQSRFELSPSKSVAMRFGGEKFSVHERLASIYLQLFNAEDNGLLLLLWEIIEMRNIIIHGYDSKKNPYSKYPVGKEEFLATYKHLELFEESYIKQLMEELDNKKLLKRNNDRNTQAGFPFRFHHNTAHSRRAIQLTLVCLEGFIGHYLIAHNPVKREDQ